MELRLTLEGGRTGATPAAFYLGLCRLRGNLSLPAPATVILQASHYPCDHDKAAGGPFNTATTGFRRRNYSSLRQRKLESDAHRCGYD